MLVEVISQVQEAIMLVVKLGLIGNPQRAREQWVDA